MTFTNTTSPCSVADEPTLASSSSVCIMVSSRVYLGSKFCRSTGRSSRVPHMVINCQQIWHRVSCRQPRQQNMTFLKKGQFHQLVTHLNDKCKEGKQAEW